ncbi:hypothetical protein Tco_0541047 [Tanacetum coccineum]
MTTLHASCLTVQVAVTRYCSSEVVSTRLSRRLRGTVAGSGSEPIIGSFYLEADVAAYGSSKAITPDLSIEEPDNSLSVSEDTCDVHFYVNSPLLDVLNDHFEIFSNSNNDCTLSDNESFEDIDYIEASPLKDFLIMGNEELSTIPEKESDEFIKSSVEDLIPIPRETEDSSRSDSESILPSSDDFSPIFEEKSVTFSNPLFNSNDFTSITAYRSFPILDEDEFPPQRLRWSSTFTNNPSISVTSIFIDEPPLEENDDLFDLESKENDWKKILYDAPIDDLITEEIKVFEPLDINKKSFSLRHFVKFKPLRIAIIFPSHLLSEYFYLISLIRWILLFFSPPGVRTPFLTLASTLLIFLLLSRWLMKIRW